MTPFDLMIAQLTDAARDRFLTATQDEGIPVGEALEEILSTVISLYREKLEEMYVLIPKNSADPTQRH